MLAYLLAILVGFGSFALYMIAFFIPEVHRKNDFIWSGIGLFYGLILWGCAGRITGALLLGQIASVVLLGCLTWEMLNLRRSLTPVAQQTPIEIPQETVKSGSKFFGFWGQKKESSPIPAVSTPESQPPSVSQPPSAEKIPPETVSETVAETAESLEVSVTSSTSTGEIPSETLPEPTETSPELSKVVEDSVESPTPVLSSLETEQESVESPTPVLPSVEVLSEETDGLQEKTPVSESTAESIPPEKTPVSEVSVPKTTTLTPQKNLLGGLFERLKNTFTHQKSQPSPSNSSPVSPLSSENQGESSVDDFEEWETAKIPDQNLQDLDLEEDSIDENWGFISEEIAEDSVVGESSSPVPVVEVISSEDNISSSLSESEIIPVNDPSSNSSELSGELSPELGEDQSFLTSSSSEISLGTQELSTVSQSVEIKEQSSSEILEGGEEKSIIPEVISPVSVDIPMTEVPDFPISVESVELEEKKNDS